MSTINHFPFYESSLYLPAVLHCWWCSHCQHLQEANGWRGWMARDSAAHLKQKLTTPKCFKSERGTVRRGKEGKILPHSTNKPGRCSVGIQSVEKVLELPQTSRTPKQQTCKSRDGWEAHGKHQTIRAGLCATLTEEHYEGLISVANGNKCL